GQPAGDEVTQIRLGTKRPAEPQHARMQARQQPLEMRFQTARKRLASGCRERLARLQCVVSQRTPARYDVVCGMRRTHAAPHATAARSDTSENMKPLLLGLLLLTFCATIGARELPGDNRILAAREALRTGDRDTLERLAA